MSIDSRSSDIEPDRVSDNRFVKHLELFRVFAIGLTIFGVGGIALGVYVQFFRPSSPGELILNRSLLLYPIAIVLSALVHFGALRALRTLTNSQK